MSVAVTAVPVAPVSSAPPAANRPLEEARDEPVELVHPLLGHIDRDLLVLLIGSDIRLHVCSFRIAYGYKHSTSKYLSETPSHERSYDPAGDLPLPGQPRTDRGPGRAQLLISGCSQQDVGLGVQPPVKRVADQDVGREYALKHVWTTKQDDDGRARPGTARPGDRDAGARATRRFGNPTEAAFPRGFRAGDRRDGLLLGRRARLLAGARGLHHRGRLRRRDHAQPHLRG